MFAKLARLSRLVRRERIPLRGRAMAAIATDQPNASDAVRWLGLVGIAGDARQALFCHPVSSASYVVRARPGDALRTGCALHPDVREKNSGGCAFRVTVRGTNAGSITREVVVAPTDRRWRDLRVPAPVDREAAVTIELSTRVPDGASGDYAWGLWGDPSIERRRPLGETRQMVVRAWATASRAGARAAVRELRATGEIDERTAAYRRWAEAHAPDAPALDAMRAEAAALPFRPRISVITPVYNPDPRWLLACIDSVRSQVYPDWELCLADDASTSEAVRAVLRQQMSPRVKVTRLERNAGISAASNAALAMATGEYVALLDHDDELTPDALFRVVAHLNAERDTDVVYSDEDKRDEDGKISEPFFKPCWSPEHLLSAMYTCHLTVARRALVDRVGGFRLGYEGSQDHDLFLRMSEVTQRIDHLPRVLYHWRRTPQSTASAGSTKPWATDAGKRALEDYLRRNHIDGEVVLGGVPGLYRVKFAVVGSPRVQVIRVGDATPTQAINAAVRASGADHVVIVHDGLHPLDDGWMSAMLEYSQQPAIAAVGAKVQYADGRLRHIGMVTCLDAGPAPVFDGYPPDVYGYFSSAIGVRNYAAVSGECLMTRREVFDRLGGFDERLPWLGADVDYCVRSRQAGYRLVFTPYARLQYTGTPPQRPRGTPIDDPYFNSNLSHATADYGLD
jgi:GT2 family glycosyltransferase